jgi:hypothetical protein
MFVRKDDVRMSRAQRSKTQTALGAKSQLDLFSVSLDANTIAQEPVALRSVADKSRQVISPTAASKFDRFAKPAAAAPVKMLDQVVTRSPQNAHPPMPRLSVASPAQPSGAQRLPDFSGDLMAPRQGALLDVRQAAAWLGLSKSTLDKMRCYGIGTRFIRATSRAIRYDPRDLHDFAAARRQATSELG